MNYKEKIKTTDKSTLSESKIKNIKLTDVLHYAAKENSTQVIQKMLHIIVLNIIIENILRFNSITHKLMFKLSKLNIIVKISDIKKINIKSVQLQNVLYSLMSSKTIVKIDDKQIFNLLNIDVEINFIEKKYLKKLSILYSVNC